MVEITATAPTIVLMLAAADADSPNPVNNGISAKPPEATTATIANTAPITIVTVMRISFQCSLHHSQALSTFSSNQLFSISGFKYSYFS